jgi:hypothetical protein
LKKFPSKRSMVPICINFGATGKIVFLKLMRMQNRYDDCR